MSPLTEPTGNVNIVVADPIFEVILISRIILPPHIKVVLFFATIPSPIQETLTAIFRLKIIVHGDNVISYSDIVVVPYIHNLVVVIAMSLDVASDVK